MADDFRTGGMGRAAARGGCIVAGLLLGVLATAAAGDELELVSGRKYKGLVVEQTPEYVVFRIYTSSGGQMVVRYAMREVASLEIDGREPTVELPRPAPAPPPAEPPKPPPDPPSPQPGPASHIPAPAPAGAMRSRTEVEAVIDGVGKTPPDWWDSVALKYPDTLDLPGTKPAQGFQPQRNLGAYFWGVVNPNPQRWREGIRLLHHVLTVRKDDKPRLAQSMHQLADCYDSYEQDWARSAFWRQKAMVIDSTATVHGIASLARCYWMLGSKPMAAGLLGQYGLAREGYPPNIKLFADMGELDVAMRLSLGLARAQPVEGYVMAGDVCRAAGKYAEAMDYYQKVVGDPQSKKKDRYLNRAVANIEAIRLYEGLDLSRVPDGTHAGSSMGFRGPVDVEVAVRGGRILSVRIVRQKEDEFFYHMAARETPKRIVDKQAVKGVDAVTGATVTSDAIINATAKALASAAARARPAE